MLRSAAESRARFIDGAVHVASRMIRVLALTQIVVRTPDDHVARFAARRRPGRVRKVAPVTLQVGENPIAALALHLPDGVLERGLVINHLSHPPNGAGRAGPLKVGQPPPHKLQYG